LLGQDLANTAWAFAKVAIRNEPLFEAIAISAMLRMPESDPQNLANIAWSFATVKIQHMPLVGVMSEHALATMKQFGPQELANFAWALSTLMFVHTACLNALANRAVTGLHAGSIQNLTNTAWAFAQMKVKNTTLLYSIAQEVIRTIPEFRARDLSITAWSFARLEVRDENLISAIASAAASAGCDFGGCHQEIANLSWSMALLDYRDKNLLEALSGAAMRTDMRQFSAQEMTNTVWAFASLRYAHQPLLHAIATRAMCHLHEAISQNVVNTAWALDCLGSTDPEEEVFPNILQHFLKVCTGSLGIEWITLASIAEDRCLASRVPQFMVEFESLVLKPALELLSLIRVASDDAIRLEQLQHLQDWVERVQVPHLGPTYTGDALKAAGAKHAESTWSKQAQEEVLASAWWSCPHAAVSSQGVVAWAAAFLEVSGGKAEEHGEVYFADDSAGPIFVERMLQPIFMQVARGGHAERRALVTLLRAALRMIGQSSAQGTDRLEDTAGWVKLYASHYLCISCLAVVAQFTRLLPKVHLEVAYDNAWASWTERAVPSGEVLSIGRAA